VRRSEVIRIAKSEWKVLCRSHGPPPFFPFFFSQSLVRGCFFFLLSISSPPVRWCMIKGVQRRGSFLFSPFFFFFSFSFSPSFLCTPQLLDGRDGGTIHSFFPSLLFFSLPFFLSLSDHPPSFYQRAMNCWNAARKSDVLFSFLSPFILVQLHVLYEQVNHDKDITVLLCPFFFSLPFFFQSVRTSDPSSFCGVMYRPINAVCSDPFLSVLFFSFSFLFPFFSSLPPLASSPWEEDINEDERIAEVGSFSFHRSTLFLPSVPLFPTLWGR